MDKMYDLFLKSYLCYNIITWYAEIILQLKCLLLFPDYLCPHVSLATTFVHSEMNAQNYAHIPNINVTNMCVNMEMVMQIFVAFGQKHSMLKFYHVLTTVLYKYIDRFVTNLTSNSMGTRYKYLHFTFLHILRTLTCTKLWTYITYQTQVIAQMHVDTSILKRLVSILFPMQTKAHVWLSGTYIEDMDSGWSHVAT